MQRLKKQTRVCTDCALAKTRVNVVCGSGDVNAKLVLVGEGPSAADNHTGFPFSGPAGNMLDEVLVASGLTRSEIWLTNIIKCRAVGSQDGELHPRQGDAGLRADQAHAQDGHALVAHGRALPPGRARRSRPERERSR